MKLKQWIFAAALAIAPATALADTYAVWPAAGDGETQIPVEFNHWWNFSSEVVESDGVQATKCFATDGGAACSSGWLVTAAQNFDFTQIANANLVFDVKVEGEGTWKIRLTAPDQDYTVNVPADGAFHSVSISVKDNFNNVYANWANGNANGKDIFPFAVVGEGLNGGSALYFTNCRYITDYPVPVINAGATDVTAESANIVYSVTFPEGYTNTAVKLNGESVAPAGTVALTGLSPRTDYTYILMASGDYNGQSLSFERAVTFKTNVGEARDYVYNDIFETTFNNAWRIGGDPANRENIPASLAWSVTYRADETAVYAIDLTGYDNIVGLVPQIWNGAGIVALAKNAESGLWEYDFGHRELDGDAAMSHYLAYDGGVIDQRTPYTKWGMEKAAPSGIRITAKAQNVTAESAEIAYEVSGADNFKVYFKGASGEAVEATANPIVLAGLTPKTTYTYEVYAKADDIESEHVSVTFTTARPDGEVAVWYGSTDKPGFSAEYSIAYNPDKTLTVEATFETEKETPAADRNFHIFVGGDEWLKLVDDGTGLHKGTTSKTYEEGNTITWEWYLPYAGGVYQESNQYVVGSANEAPLAIRVKAAAQNVTATSAEIAYEVTGTVEYRVYYKADGADAVEATANPILLTGLTEKTAYNYEVYAVAMVEGSALESKHVTVSFKTPALNAVDLVYADYLNAEFKNAYLIGEPETSRRSIYAAMPWSVTFRADETAVYAIDLSAVEKVVGFTPQIYWNGFRALTKNPDTGLYEFEFGAQTAEEGTAISHYIAYAGNAVDVRSPYTNWGMEHELPVLGEAVSLELKVSNDYVKIGEPFIITYAAKDGAGYYLPVDEVELTPSGENLVIDGATATINNAKGEYFVNASMGDLTASTRVLAVASTEAENLISGVKGIVNADYVSNGTVDNVTDADRNSQLEWNCADTQEHYIVFDLAAGEGAPIEGYYIEAVEVYFEGAYATKFNVTLSSMAPAELETSATPAAYAWNAAATTDVVFNNDKNDVQHMFTQDPDAQHRYVTLRTQEALNPGWGIKLRDMKVYGTVAKPSSTTTGVENISLGTDDANTPVEYYNLNGVRIDNPAAGLYIRRQGNIAVKVLVK